MAAEGVRSRPQIRAIDGDEDGEANRVLAGGLRDNPLELAAFSRNPARRRAQLERLFRAASTLPNQQRSGAFVHGRLVGVSVLAEPGACQPSASHRVRLALVLTSIGPLVAARVARWQLAWSRRDLAEPHSHLVLLAVRHDAQRRGVGSALIADYCRRLDEREEVCYLETDRAENLAFYFRHGYEVVGQAHVLGERNWFLRRSPRK